MNKFLSFFIGFSLVFYSGFELDASNWAPGINFDYGVLSFAFVPGESEDCLMTTGGVCGKFVSSLDSTSYSQSSLDLTPGNKYQVVGAPDSTVANFVQQNYSSLVAPFNNLMALNPHLYVALNSSNINDSYILFNLSDFGSCQNLNTTLVADYNINKIIFDLLSQGKSATEAAINSWNSNSGANLRIDTSILDALFDQTSGRFSPSALGAAYLSKSSATVQASIVQALFSLAVYAIYSAIIQGGSNYNPTVCPGFKLAAPQWVLAIDEMNQQTGASYTQVDTESAVNLNIFQSNIKTTYNLLDSSMASGSPFNTSLQNLGSCLYNQDQVSSFILNYCNANQNSVLPSCAGLTTTNPSNNQNEILPAVATTPGDYTADLLAVQSGWCESIDNLNNACSASGLKKGLCPAGYVSSNSAYLSAVGINFSTYAQVASSNLGSTNFYYGTNTPNSANQSVWVVSNNSPSLVSISNIANNQNNCIDSKSCTPLSSIYLCDNGSSGYKLYYNSSPTGASCAQLIDVNLSQLSGLGIVNLPSESIAPVLQSTVSSLGLSYSHAGFAAPSNYLQFKATPSLNKFIPRLFNSSYKPQPACSPSRCVKEFKSYVTGLSANTDLIESLYSQITPYFDPSGSYYRQTLLGLSGGISIVDIYTMYNNYWNNLVSANSGLSQVMQPFTPSVLYNIVTDSANVGGADPKLLGDVSYSAPLKADSSGNKYNQYIFKTSSGNSYIAYYGDANGIWVVQNGQPIQVPLQTLKAPQNCLDANTCQILQSIYMQQQGASLYTILYNSCNTVTSQASSTGDYCMQLADIDLTSSLFKTEQGFSVAGMPNASIKAITNCPDSSSCSNISVSPAEVIATYGIVNNDLKSNSSQGAVATGNISGAGVSQNLPTTSAIDSLMGAIVQAKNAGIQASYQGGQVNQGLVMGIVMGAPMILFVIQPVKEIYTSIKNRVKGSEFGISGDQYAKFESNGWIDDLRALKGEKLIGLNKSELAKVVEELPRLESIKGALGGGTDILTAREAYLKAQKYTEKNPNVKLTDQEIADAYKLSVRSNGELTFNQALRVNEVKNRFKISEDDARAYVKEGFGMDQISRAEDIASRYRLSQEDAIKYTKQGYSDADIKRIQAGDAEEEVKIDKIIRQAGDKGIKLTQEQAKDYLDMSPQEKESFNRRIQELKREKGRAGEEISDDDISSVFNDIQTQKTLGYANDDNLNIGGQNAIPMSQDFINKLQVLQVNGSSVVRSENYPDLVRVRNSDGSFAYKEWNAESKDFEDVASENVPKDAFPEDIGE